MLTDEVLERLAKKYKDEDFSRRYKLENDERKRIGDLEHRHFQAKAYADLYKGYARNGGEPGYPNNPFASPPHKCWEAAREYERNADRIYREIEEAKKSLSGMRDDPRNFTSAKTSAQWVEGHYQSLLSSTVWIFHKVFTQNSLQA